MKKCKKDNCNSPVFSNGYCKIHHYLRSDDKYKKSYKPKRVYEKKKYHKRYPVDDQLLFKNGWIAEQEKQLLSDIYNNSITPCLDVFLGHSTGDLQQDDIIYQKEKIVSPTVQNKIRKLSKKKVDNKNQIASIKKTLQYEFDNKCFFTKLPADDAFHIFPIGKYPEYETAHWNILLSIRSINRTWDQGTWEEILAIPNIQWVFKIIWDKDNDPNKLHKGSFFEQLKNRKDKK